MEVLQVISTSSTTKWNLEQLTICIEDKVWKIIIGVKKSLLYISDDNFTDPFITFSGEETSGLESSYTSPSASKVMSYKFKYLLIIWKNFLFLLSRICYINTSTSSATFPVICSAILIQTFPWLNHWQQLLIHCLWLLLMGCLCFLLLR